MMKDGDSDFVVVFVAAADVVVAAAGIDVMLLRRLRTTTTILVDFCIAAIAPCAVWTTSVLLIVQYSSIACDTVYNTNVCVPFPRP